MVLETIRAKNFHNGNELTFGAEKPRAYYIPFEKGQDAFGEREKSKRFTDLTGEWEFCYFDDINAAEELDFTHTISVPSNWQMKGYGGNRYLNFRYPFPFAPPKIFGENPCGIYRRRIKMRLQNRKRYFIEFEGVDSCLYLFVNGEFCGYGQVSHSPQEYDITNALRDGENEVTVAVLKYCSGSYFEGQDKLRMSGIFRDVYILERDENHIVDYTVKTALQANTAKISVDFVKTGTQEIACALYCESLLLQTQTVDRRAEFCIENPRLYSAESPERYRLQLSCGNEIIGEYVAILEVKIHDSVLYINGQKVKLKGVNRHDSYPDSGYTETREKVLKDIRLMKEANINAIRTSHYPPSPLTIRLFEQYGFYMIDEADLETHATTMISGEYREADFDVLASDPNYAPMYLLRVQKLYERDKNLGCVVMWSLGNEAGWGENFLPAAMYIKQRDSRPIHYESLYGKCKDHSVLDVFSKMYPSPEWIRENYIDKKTTKPLVLCEFAHAMGNGPGGLTDYIDLLYSDDRFAGAFVWEWCDHAVAAQENGKTVYKYGGDFGEPYHDGNFCVDGLVYPDRTPHVGYYELKNTIKPIRVDADCVLHNEYDFIPLKGLSVTVTVEEKGKVVYSETLMGFDAVNPKESRKLAIDLHKFNAPLTTVTFVYDMNGENIGFDSYLLHDGRFECPTAQTATTLSLVERGENIECVGDGFRYTFSKSKGFFESFAYDGRKVTVPKRFINVFRAPIDNDCFIKQAYTRFGLDRVVFYAESTECSFCDDKALFVAKGQLLSDIVAAVAHVTLCTQVDASGKVQVTVAAQINDEIEQLPRFGVVLEMPQEFSRLAYYGMGTNESYADKCRSSRPGYYISDIESQHEPYIKPQENSSHCDTRFIAIGDKDCRMEIYPENPVSFRAGYYSDEQLHSVKNNAYLQKEPRATLYLDYKMSGVGSNSCGPLPNIKQQLRDKNIHFCFALRFCKHGV